MRARVAAATLQSMQLMAMNQLDLVVDAEGQERLIVIPEPTAESDAAQAAAGPASVSGVTPASTSTAAAAPGQLTEIVHALTSSSSTSAPPLATVTLGAKARDRTRTPPPKPVPKHREVYIAPKAKPASGAAKPQPKPEPPAGKKKASQAQGTNPASFVQREREWGRPRAFDRTKHCHNRA